MDDFGVWIGDLLHSMGSPYNLHMDGVEYGAAALRERSSRLPGMDWILRAPGSVENTAVTGMD